MHSQQQQESEEPTVEFKPRISVDQIPANKNRQQTKRNNGSQPVDVRRKKSICKFCKSSTRKYSAKGCKFGHRKKCLKCITHGNKTSRICKKGSECTHYHPPLCSSSLNNGTCDTVDCKFQHIRVTEIQRTNGNNNQPIGKAYQPINSSPQN